MARRCTSNDSQRGFSIVELAIVIAVIGIILSGIWVYARHAYEQQMLQQALEEINAVVNNVRAYYAGQVGIPETGAGPTTSNLINLGVIPSNMVRPVGANCANPSSLCADGPWGSTANSATDTQGTFSVCDWEDGKPTCTSPASATCPSLPGAPPVQSFAVIFQGLSKARCIALATRANGPGMPKGLTTISISACDAPGCTATAPTPMALPISVAQAATACNCPTNDNTAIVRFAFRLRPDNF